MVPTALSELLGQEARIMFLNLAALDLPVLQVEGALRVVTENVIHLELHSGLPALDRRSRFGVSIEGRRGLISFQTVLAEDYEPGGLQLVLQTPARVDTVQRRRFPRVRLGAPAAFSLAGARLSGSVENVGMGGMLLRCASPVPAGSEFLLDLSTEHDLLRELPCKVIRCQQGAGGQWSMACHFLDLPAHLETALVKLVWRQQLRQQKGR